MNDTSRAVVRIDKWLWAARFYKSRSIASDAIAAGHVRVAGTGVKASRTVAVGEEVSFRQGQIERTVRVLGLSDVRGPASIAQTLYEETPESLTRRAQAAEARRLGLEPALTRDEGRPTKRDRRDLNRWDRWSASLDEPS